MIFHLFSFVKNPELENDLIVLIIGALILAFIGAIFALIRRYIKSSIAEIIDERLEKNPKCIRQESKIDNLREETKKINDLLVGTFRGKFAMQQDEKNKIGPLVEEIAKKGKIMDLGFGKDKSEDPAIIYSLKDAEEIFDLKNYNVGFDKEKGEIIFRVKIRDRITVGNIFGEDVNDE